MWNPSKTACLVKSEHIRVIFIQHGHTRKTPSFEPDFRNYVMLHFKVLTPEKLLSEIHPNTQDLNGLYFFFIDLLKKSRQIMWDWLSLRASVMANLWAEFATFQISVLYMH